MKYIITENKLEKAIIHFLNKGYGDLTEYRTDEYPNSIFYMKDNKVYMEWDKENGELWVDYDAMWEDLESWFSLDFNDIQSIIAKWVEETYNIRGVLPQITNQYRWYYVE